MDLDIESFKERLMREGISRCSESELLYGIFLCATEKDVRLEEALTRACHTRTHIFQPYSEQLL